MENEKKDALDLAFDTFLSLLKAPADATGIEFFNETQYSVMDIKAARFRFRGAMFKTLQHPNMVLGAYRKGKIPIIHANRFPTLDECEEICRRSLSDNKLDDKDEHIIGTLWAFIEGRLGINSET